MSQADKILAMEILGVFIDEQMKKDILMMWDKGTIKLGQRVPMIKQGVITTQFEELIITEELIKRLRTEMRQEWS